MSDAPIALLLVLAPVLFAVAIVTRRATIALHTLRARSLTRRSTGGSPAG